MPTVPAELLPITPLSEASLAAFPAEQLGFGQPVVIPTVLPPGVFFSSATAQAATALATVLGIDIRCLVDLDPGFSLISGPNCLAQDLAHRFATQRGQLLYDTDYGRPINQLLNEGIPVSNPGVATLVAKNLEAEALKDDRVSTCSVQITFNDAAKSMAATIAVGTATGDFSLVVGITALSVSLLQVT